MTALWILPLSVAAVIQPEAHALQIRMYFPPNSADWNVLCSELSRHQKQCHQKQCHRIRTYFLPSSAASWSHLQKKWSATAASALPATTAEAAKNAAQVAVLAADSFEDFMVTQKYLQTTSCQKFGLVDHSPGLA